MTLCCGVVVKCRNMLLALYAGGAFVDYRNREGLTPMHRAAEKGNSVAIRVKYTTCTTRVTVASHTLFLTRVVHILSVISCRLCWTWEHQPITRMRVT